MFRRAHFGMHPKISVAVPTRHRKDILVKFRNTYYDSLRFGNIPYLTVIYDAPDRHSNTCLPGELSGGLTREIFNPDKSSLTELWNQCLIMSPTDWVLVCNDDIEFKKGWLEYLEEKIEAGEHDIIHLFHYGAMCIHKSLVLKIGWFDERFRGGGFEDNDHQLRIFEAGLKHRVDRSHDFIRREGNREIGHFIDHTKFIHKGEGWQGCNNADWIKEKWGADLTWRTPVVRQRSEVDWHPTMTRKYEEKFGFKEQFLMNAWKSMEEKRQVRH
jgi:glycosyltransferase involved in cell wall biosynthesis